MSRYLEITVQEDQDLDITRLQAVSLWCDNATGGRRKSSGWITGRSNAKIVYVLTREATAEYTTVFTLRFRSLRSRELGFRGQK